MNRVVTIVHDVTGFFNLFGKTVWIETIFGNLFFLLACFKLERGTLPGEV